MTVLLYLNDVDSSGHTVFPFVTAEGTPQLRHVDSKDFYAGLLSRTHCC